MQLCGWLGAHSLWVGAVSDTKYLSESGILEMQEEFIETDLTSDLPFTNIVDKGYRCVIAQLGGKASILSSQSLREAIGNLQRRIF